MRRFWIAAAMVLLSVGARANCVCTCVGGENRPLCSSSMDLQPLCPPRLCPLTPPSITPIQPPTIPPLGTSSCRQQQVLNPITGRYEWRSVCS